MRKGLDPAAPTLSPNSQLAAPAKASPRVPPELGVLESCGEQSCLEIPLQVQRVLSPPPGVAPPAPSPPCNSTDAPWGLPTTFPVGPHPLRGPHHPLMLSPLPFPSSKKRAREAAAAAAAASASSPSPPWHRRRPGGAPRSPRTSWGRPTPSGCPPAPWCRTPASLLSSESAGDGDGCGTRVPPPQVGVLGVGATSPCSSPSFFPPRQPAAPRPPRGAPQRRHRGLSAQLSALPHRRGAPHVLPASPRPRPGHGGRLLPPQLPDPPPLPAPCLQVGTSPSLPGLGPPLRAINPPCHEFQPSRMEFLPFMAIFAPVSPQDG